MNLIEQLERLDLKGRQAKVYLALLQLGSASAIGKLTTPTLASLGVDAPANVVLSFNAAPYYEPNLATGKFETAPNQGSGTTVVVTVNGDGTFDDGTQTQRSGIVRLSKRAPMPKGIWSIRSIRFV